MGSTIAILAALLLGACGLPPAEPIVISRTPTPHIDPSPTSAPPTATPEPSPTPTLAPTATPTPDWSTPQAIAAEGLREIQPADGGTVLLCFRYEDTDADGQPEWVGVMQQQTQTPRLVAFVLDGEAVYPLEPAYPKAGEPDIGLGQYAVCDLEIRDVNGDGIAEIAIFGHAAGNKTLLHLFAWDQDAYRRLGFFSGDAGVRFVNADGEVADTIWEGHRVQESPQLAWNLIHTWRDNTYGWSSDAYEWYFATRPQSYPVQRAEDAVISYYLALNDRDLPGAFALLVPDEQRSYASWAVGYATTLQVRVGSVQPISASVTDSSARIAAMVSSWDNEGGTLIGQLWNVEWATVRTTGGWKLSSSTAERLEEWPVTLWP